VTSTVAVSRTPVAQPTFREVFAVREFRALWASQILSELGDRLTLVALTLLIYAKTGSPLLSALTYAAGSLPWVMGSLAFSGLGDRLPRRQVMVACDLIRALMVTAMLLPGIPVAALVGLLYLTTMAQSPFEAARSAVLPDVLAEEHYALAATVMQTTFRVAMVAGAAVGGAAIAFLGARPALAVDAATFAASAVLIRWGTRARPAPVVASGLRAARQLSDGLRLLLGDRTIRTVMMLGWLIALYSIPEGIAAPYVARLSGGPLAAGLVVASGQAGAVLVAPVFARKVGSRSRLRWMGPMAACSCASLLLIAFHPGLVVSLLIFALSGTFAIYQIAANTAFVQCVPADRRSQAFGLASMGTVASQGGALLIAGAATEFLSPATVIAISGAVGAVAAVLLALRWRHLSPALGHPAPDLGPRSPDLDGPAPRPATVPAAAPVAPPRRAGWTDRRDAYPARPAAYPARPAHGVPVLAHQVPASRCRPEPSYRLPHPRQLPACSLHRRALIPSARHHPVDYVVRHLARPRVVFWHPPSSPESRAPQPCPGEASRIKQAAGAAASPTVSPARSASQLISATSLPG